jgi:glucodextranase-like protein
MTGGPAPLPRAQAVQSWTSGAKDLVMTALGTSGVWATIGQGILNETSGSACSGSPSPRPTSPGGPACSSSRRYQDGSWEPGTRHDVALAAPGPGTLRLSGDHAGRLAAGGR